MKNILRVFCKDIARLRNNAIALVVVMGITVLPCLYAWFNIAACWDPYQNTGSLQVAVASEDEGYTGTLIPVQLNIGEKVLSALRANSLLDWVFTTQEKAVEGVKDGQYYAAIVIPQDFSSKMMSLFSQQVEKPEIVYYSNDKENAIAPKVTDEGATAIQEQVNEIFIQTVSDTVLTALQTVSKLAEETGDGTITENLARNLQQMSDELYACANTMEAFSLMSSSAQQMLSATSVLLEQAQTNVEKTIDALQRSETELSQLQASTQKACQEIDSALASARQFYDQAAKILEPALAAENADTQTAADTVAALAQKTEPVLTSYRSMRDALSSLAQTQPDLAQEIQPVIDEMDTALSAQTEFAQLLTDTADSLRTANAQAQSAQQKTEALLHEGSGRINTLETQAETDLQTDLQQLFTSLETVQRDTVSLLEQLQQTMGQLSTLSDVGASDLLALQDALEAAFTHVTQGADRLAQAAQELTQLQQSQDFSLVEFLLSSNPQSVSVFLASPVKLVTTELYPVANYGSGMAPFYSALAIWIGGIVLVAMMKVDVPASYRQAIPRLRAGQAYVGRYLLFLLLGLLQSALICLGDLYFLGIQCLHPGLFVLAGLFSGVVYGNIIYTLTVSFGDLGKAASIVLLVVQVAGSGGTFPIEVTPAFFQDVYPLLPFTHTLRAMRECIGGMYGNTYWREMGILGLYLLGSLLFGLVVRPLILPLTRAFANKVEESKVI